MAAWIDPTTAPQPLHLSLTCSPSASATMEPLHWTPAFEWGTTGKCEKSAGTALPEKRLDVRSVRQLHTCTTLSARESKDFRKSRKKVHGSGMWAGCGIHIQGE